MEENKYAAVRKRLEQERQTTALQRRHIEGLEKRVTEQMSQIQAQEKLIQQQSEQIAQYQAELQTKDREILRLKNLLEELSTVTQSRSIFQENQDISPENTTQQQQVYNIVDEDDDDDKTVDEYSSPFRSPFPESPIVSRLRSSISSNDTHLSIHDASSVNNRFPVSPIRTSDLLHDIGNLKSPVRPGLSHTKGRVQANAEIPQQPLLEPGEQPYVNAVRRKSERVQLLADACKYCAPFYQATGNIQGPDGRILTPFERIQMTCRHRQRFKRPSTPPGYWDMDFISTQQIEDAERRRKDEHRKKT